ncbi:MAG TPA: metalloregulator ArsR/SmtB family transcription factor [Enhygromyxa sp.]|nr:metalloregulator ArsR/SmtB family transcription factor [Enhygromyxa sp.]
MSAAERLDAAFAALADPTRRAILLRLVEGEATVNELVEPFAISQPAISRHLKVLEGAGLIVRRVDGARRPCALAPGALDDLDAYLAKLRDAMETNYSRLDQLLARAQSKPTTPSKRNKKDRK